MKSITPTEAKILRKILLNHNAWTLSPDCDDHPKLNLILDHLRSMLLDISYQEQEPKGYVTKTLARLIKTEDEQMETMRQTDPGIVQEK